MGKQSSRTIWSSTSHWRTRQTLYLALCLSWLMLDSCLRSEKHNVPMELTPLLDAVTDEKIEFVTTRGDRSPMPTMGRHVVVTGPPEVMELMSLGDVRVLEELANLLPKPKRAWAAEVVLASLTHHEEDLVNAFAADPKRWRESVGKGAYGRWSEWLESRRGKLIWNPDEHAFVEK
jgi:hypothetical protein